MVDPIGTELLAAPANSIFFALHTMIPAFSKMFLAWMKTDPRYTCFTSPCFSCGGRDEGRGGRERGE